MSKTINRSFSVLLMLVLVFAAALPLRVEAAPNDYLTFPSNANESDHYIAIKTDYTGGDFYVFSTSSASKTFTFTNSSDKKISVEFDYVEQAGGGDNGATRTLTFSDNVNAGNGHASVSLAADEEFSFTLAVTMTGTEETELGLFLSNIEVSEVQAVTITVGTDGSGTVTGCTAGADGKVEVPESGLTLTATPSSGSKFLGWVDQDNKRLSTEATYKVEGTATLTGVKACFADSTPWFLVADTGANYLIKGVTDAANKAKNAANKTMVLLNDATLASGSYEVPAGVTMLIPFDDAHTLCNAGRANLVQTDWVTPEAYRTLTMADGATLTVKGKLSVAGSQTGAMGPNERTTDGAPTGPLGILELAKGSSVVVANGGTLYAWGYIARVGAGNEGTVTVQSGGTVYEDFQVTDFRGGSFTTTMVMGESLGWMGSIVTGILNVMGVELRKDVFPFSQYYVQNVQVPMTIEAGGTEKVIFTASIGNMDEPQNPEVEFIGNSAGMFRLGTGGSITKDYVEADDRLQITVRGKMTMASISLSMRLSADSEPVNIVSTNFKLPLNGNISIILENGADATVSQSFCLLPNSVIHIKDGAAITLSSGAEVFVYDIDQWGPYCSAANVRQAQVKFAWPQLYKTDRVLDADAKIIVGGTLNATAGKLYVTEGGAQILGADDSVGKVVFTSGSTKKTYQSSIQRVQKFGVIDRNMSVGTPITVKAPTLLNANGGTEGSIPASGSNKTYEYYNSKWCEHKNKSTIAAVAATCQGTGLTAGEKCDDCGKILKAQETTEQLDHSYTGEYQIVDGGHKQKCVNGCNEYGDVVAHKYTSVVTDPTCTEDGYTTYTCACTHSYTGDTVPSLGHKFEGEWVKTETGHAKKCKVCGTPDTEVAHNAGTPVNENVVDSYCYAEGSYNEVVYCNECNYKISSTPKTIEKKAHTSGEAKRENVVDAKCNADGSYNEVVRCTVAECNAIITSTPKTISATNEHDYSGDWVYTVDGHAQKCVNGCDQPNPTVTGHTAAVAVQENVNPATCTAPGSYEEVVYCAVEDCHHEISRETKTIEQLPHIYNQSEVADKYLKAPATCTTQAVYYKSCECGAFSNAEDADTFEHGEPLGHADTNKNHICDHNCGKEDIGTHEAAAGSHDCAYCGEAVTECKDSLDAQDGKAATCTEDGFNAYWTCTVCSANYTDDQAATKIEDLETWKTGDGKVGIIAHNMMASQVVNPTCIADGYTVYACSYGCGTTENRETVEALGHSWTDATCTAPKTCSVCGATEGEALGHTPGVAADCVNAQTCTVCGAVLNAALGHTWTDATCTAPKTCKVCNATEGEALGHTPGAAADCENAQTCTVCGTVLNAALGHDWAAATCTAAKTCKTCGKTEGEALGHAYEETYTYTDDEMGGCTFTATRTCKNGCELNETAVGTVVGDPAEIEGKEANCVDYGRGNYTVSFDVDWAEEYVYKNLSTPKDSTNHKALTEHPAVAPTCTQNGQTAWSNCPTSNGGCGHKFSESETIPALGHEYGNPVWSWNASAESATCTVTFTCTRTGCTDTTEGHTIQPKVTVVEQTRNNATCTAVGSVTYTATVKVGETEYSDSKTVEILKAAHTEEILEAVAPTCTTTGLTEGKKCSVCGEILKAQVEIPAKHTLEKVEAKATTCTEAGNIEHWKCTAEGCGKLFADAEGQTETDADKVKTEAKGHTVKAEFTWAEDAYTCTVKLTCEKCPAVLVESAACDVKTETVDATCTVDGKTTYTASYAYEGKTYANEETKVEVLPATGKHTYVDGKCEVCGKAENTYSEIMQIKSAALMFRDEIQIKYYFTVAGATAQKLENAGIEIWNEADYNPDNLGKPTKTMAGLARNGSRYEIVTEGIAAKNMGDLMYVRGYIEINGKKEYTQIVEYSPEKYCLSKIESAQKKPNDAEAQALAKLCISLLNYGAEAQKYFAKTSDYQYTRLMNSELTDAQKVWIYNENMVTKVKGIPAYNWTADKSGNVSLKSASVIMTGALQIKVYAEAKNASVKLLYWTEASAGTELRIENAVEMSEIGPNGTRYQGYIKGIAAKNMGDTVYICASVVVDGETYYTAPVAYSIHKYAASKASGGDMADLAKTLVIYSNAAKEYLAISNS